MNPVAIFSGEVVETHGGQVVVRVHHNGVVDEYPAGSRHDGMIKLEASLANLEQYDLAGSASAAEGDRAGNDPVQLKLKLGT